jgi:transposase
MRTDLMPDTLWEAAERLLPPHPPSPKGGRPRVSDRACLTALTYLLREGCTYRGLPCKELGCGSGVTVWRRLQEWTRAGVWPALHETLLQHLGRAGEVDPSLVVADSSSCRAVKGGEHTGPNPTDRSKQGCKRHVLTDRNGIPLVVRTGPANQNDEQRLEELLRRMPVVPTKAGKPRRVLAVMADAAYGVAWVVALVLAMGYRALLKPRGKAGQVHGSGLGKKRYVVERTMAWLDNDRRLRICYERTWHSWQGLHELSACVFCAKRLDCVCKGSLK